MKTVAIFLAILFAGTLLYFLFSDPVSFLLFGILVGILIFVLFHFGFVHIEAKPDELDITYKPIPVPSSSTAQGIQPTTASILPSLSEVFYVANNMFTYDQAPAVCKAYGSEIASYSQVEEAYSRGAEWCGYGWTSGGMALFPTQEETWRKLQLEVDPAKRIACGRPGINGGYFEPSLKFGVNCYGVRPQRKKDDISSETDKTFAASVKRLKGLVDGFSVYPFSKKDWSEYNNIVSSETKINDLGAGIEHGIKDMGKGVTSGVKTAGKGIENTAEAAFKGAYDTTSNLVTGFGSGIDSMFQGIGSIFA
jgi:hypothetical protein